MKATSSIVAGTIMDNPISNRLRNFKRSGERITLYDAWKCRTVYRIITKKNVGTPTVKTGFGE
jgi:hypothetical protein